MVKKEIVAGNNKVKQNNYQDVYEKEEYKIYDYYDDEIYKEYIIKYSKKEDIKDLDEKEWKELINIIRRTFCSAEYYNVKTHIEIGGGLDTGYKSLSIDDLKSEIENIARAFNYNKKCGDNTEELNEITNNISNENQHANHIKRMKK